MPNWCRTKITFDGPDAENLKKNIDDWSFVPEAENNYGEVWLGTYAVKSGVLTEEELKTTTMKLRGSVIDIDDQVKHNRFSICTETAWGPMMDIWEKIVDKMNYDVNIYYTAEEPGCELFITNDPDMEGRYFLDCFVYGLNEFDNNDDYFYGDLSEEELRRYLKEICRIKEIDIDGCFLGEIISRINDFEFDDDEYCAINQYESA